MFDEGMTEAPEGTVPRRRPAAMAAKALLVAAPAAALAVFVTATGNADANRPASAPPAPAADAQQVRIASRAVHPGDASPAATDQIAVLESGDYQGRHWRFIRDRFIVTVAQDGVPQQDLLEVPHLPFDQHGKPGTVACEALGYQFGDAPAGVQPDYNAGYACTPAGQGDQYATPTRFQALGFANEVDKQTGAPTIMEAFGDGPALGVAGSTAVSATLKVDGVRIEHRQLVKAPGDRTAYFAFLVHATSDHSPTVLVTLYDAAGRQVSTIDMAPPSTGPGLTK